MQTLGSGASRLLPVDHIPALAGTDGGRGYAVLAGRSRRSRAACPCAASIPAEGVVDLVCAGVIQVFTLEEDLGTTHFAGHAVCVVDRGGATDEMRQLVFKLGDKRRVILIPGVGVFEFVDGVGQRFRNKTATVNSEMA